MSENRMVRPGEQALSQDRIAELKSNLRELRFEHHIMFKEIAEFVDVPVAVISDFLADRGRARHEIATTSIFEKVDEFAKRNKISLGSAIKRYQATVMRDMGLDQGTLSTDVKRFKGDYLCYTLNSNDIGVTNVTLLRQRQPSTWPKFTQRRKEFLAIGHYYVFQSVLYLVGHEYNTGYPRLMSLWQDSRVAENALVGTISGATKHERSILSWCYMKRTTFIQLRKEKGLNVGRFTKSEIEEQAPDVFDYFKNKTYIVERSEGGL